MLQLMGVAQAFMGKHFLHRVQTTKSTKILPLENYPLYGSICCTTVCVCVWGGRVGWRVYVFVKMSVCVHYCACEKNFVLLNSVSFRFQLLKTMQSSV